MSNWKVKSTHVSTVISIALVLLMIGLIGVVMINAKQLSDDFKKNIKYSIYLKNNINEAELLKFNKTLNAKSYVISATYKSKEEAAEELRKELNSEDDPFEILDGQIPLPNSIDLKFHPDYSNPDSIAVIEAELKGQKPVRELVFHQNLIYKIHNNSKTIALYLLGISGILTVIAIALINNTIKLTVYSKRFVIRTMQLVGANPSFIQKPFMLNAVLQGFIGGLLAVLMLIGFIQIAQDQLPDLREVENQKYQLMLFGGIILLGIFFTWLSTLLSVRKYLRKNVDQLTLG